MHYTHIWASWYLGISSKKSTSLAVFVLGSLEPLILLALWFLSGQALPHPRTHSGDLPPCSRCFLLLQICSVKWSRSCLQVSPFTCPDLQNTALTSSLAIHSPGGSLITTWAGGSPESSECGLWLLDEAEENSKAQEREGKTPHIQRHAVFHFRRSLQSHSTSQFMSLIVLLNTVVKSKLRKSLKQKHMNR